LAEDINGLIYVTPNMGTEIGVYSKNGELVRIIDQFDYKAKYNVSPNVIWYDKNNHCLIISDQWNIKIHRFDLNTMKIANTFSYPTEKIQGELPEKKVPVNPNAKICYGDVGISSIVGMNNGGFIVLGILVLENKPNIGILFKVDKLLSYKGDIISFGHNSNTLFSDCQCIAIDKASGSLFALYGGRYIYSIEEGKYHQVFDSCQYGLSLTSICIRGGFIFGTVYGSKIKIIKLTKDGHILYQYQNSAIGNPTCIINISESLAVVSRGNSKVFLLQNDY